MTDLLSRPVLAPVGADDGAVDDMLAAVSAAEAPLVLLTGLAGTGRTTLLAQLATRQAAEGRHVSALRFTRAGDLLPTDFALSAEGERGGAAARLRGPVPHEPAWAAIGPVAGAAADPAVASRAAHAAMAALLRAGDRTVLLLDDLQWIDRDSLAVLEALVPLLGRRRLTCVATLRVPVTGDIAGYGPEVLARLRKTGLADTLRLRPLTRPAIAGYLQKALGVAPESALIDRVHALSRGVLAAVVEAVEALNRHGGIRIVDRTAYLVPGATADTSSAGVYLQSVRDLGQDAWETAKATALLFPLGSAVPDVAAAVIGIAPEEMRNRLSVLCAAGLLHSGKSGATWRFPIPLLATALARQCGPYERRALAAAAVGAVWTETAASSDPGNFADLIAKAGRLLDPTRAAGELIRQGTEAEDSDAESALRWLEAAAELTDEPALHAQVLLRLAEIHHRRGDYEQSLGITRTLLDGPYGGVNSGPPFDAVSLFVRGLSGLRDTSSLQDIAEGRQVLPGDVRARTAARALAYALLDRWAEAVQWAGAAEQPARNDEAEVAVQTIKTLGALWQGRPEPFEQSLLDRARWPLRDTARYRAVQIDAHLGGLLLNGELGRAERLLDDEGLTWAEVGTTNRTTAAVLRGELRIAAESACRAVAHRSVPGFDAATTGMFHATVSALVGQARLTTARALLTAATETTPVLAHLLDFSEARIDRAMGDDRRAAGRLTTALDAADERGLVVGCDVAYADLADLALDLGDRKKANDCRKAAERLAASMPGDRTHMLARFAAAVVSTDPSEGAECLRAARQRHQPFELSCIILRLVKHGVADPVLLSEAYALLGELGALLLRAKARTLMRDHGVVVPGRQNTVTENEQLLATLAAQGLSNKQIAAALVTSEKSVEGRLSRLFTRSGHRSRIELAASIVQGELAV